jgi:hypothetical protein
MNLTKIHIYLHSISVHLKRFNILFCISNSLYCLTVMYLDSYQLTFIISCANKFVALTTHIVSPFCNIYIYPFVNHLLHLLQGNDLGANVILFTSSGSDRKRLLAIRIRSSCFH